MTSRPRILYVGHQDPTGRSAGATLRLLGIARSLASSGTVDYLQRRGRSWTSVGSAVTRQPVPSTPFDRWTQVAGHGVPHRLKPALRYPWAVGAVLAPGRARPLLAARYPRISARALHKVVPEVDDYDLIWFYKLETILAFWPLFSTTSVPCVADIDDLVSADRDAVVAESSDPDRTVFTRTRAVIERRIDDLDRSAWTRWQQRIVQYADTVVLSNFGEAASLRAHRVRVVPNGYTVLPARGPRPLQARPVFTFVGSMHYFPNADAARFFIGEVLPELRRELGKEFDVRFVGEIADSVRSLVSQPNVSFTGYVDELAPQLATTDVAIVPLRHGSGTRLKILEAFSHEIPVVSTAIGASGLEAREGEHLLVADSASEFAQACARVVRDRELRTRLVSAAHDLVARRYDWGVVGEPVRAIVDETIAGGHQRDDST